jgi:D-xylose transport system ATP-binding protein
MAAQVKRSDVTQTQIVELITAGRSGDLGIQPDGNGNGNGNGNGLTAAGGTGVAAALDAAEANKADTATDESEGTDGVTA